MICNVAILSRFSRVNGGKIDMLYSVKKDVDNPISPPCFFKKRFSKQLRRIRWRKFETRFDKYRGTDTKTPFRYYPELDNLLFLCIPSFSSVAVTVKSVCVCVRVYVFEDSWPCQLYLLDAFHSIVVAVADVDDGRESQEGNCQHTVLQKSRLNLIWNFFVSFFLLFLLAVGFTVEEISPLFWCGVGSIGWPTLLIVFTLGRISLVVVSLAEKREKGLLFLLLLCLFVSLQFTLYSTKALPRPGFTEESSAALLLDTPVVKRYIAYTFGHKHNTGEQQQQKEAGQQSPRFCCIGSAQSHL